jgi:uncharacterized protein
VSDRPQVPSDKSLPTPQGQYVQLIKSYGPGHFSIAGKDWREPILVTDTFTVAWPVARADELALANLAALKEAPFPAELLVVGCGAKGLFIKPDVRATLKAAGLALDVMDTGSACRMYNVLLAEGRRVAAALIPL